MSRTSQIQAKVKKLGWEATGETDGLALTEVLRATAYRGLCGELTKDKVPLLKVALEGEAVTALIDSGACSCVISSKLCRTLNKVVIDTSRMVVVDQVASSVKSEGIAYLSVQWVGGYKCQRFVVMPNMSQVVILGRDFIRGAEIVPDVSRGVWTSVRVPVVEVPFETVTVMTGAVNNNAQWGEKLAASTCPIDSNEKLLAVFKEYRHAFEFLTGSAIGVDHCIRIGEHAPVVSRFRPLNAKKGEMLETALNEFCDLGIVNHLVLLGRLTQSYKKKTIPAQSDYAESTAS